MRAAVVDAPGGPEALVVRDLPTPEARPGWTLVRVCAFGLNRAELMTRRGESGDAVRFPRVHANLDRTFALDEISAAHAYMEANRATGKVVGFP